MLKFLKSNLLIIIIDLVTMLVCIVSYINFINKPDLPISINVKNGLLKIARYIKIENVKFYKDERILSVNLKYTTNIEEVEYICDNNCIGDFVTIQTLKDDKVNYKYVKLIPYYDNFFIIIQTVVILIFVFPAIYVLRMNKNFVSYVFHFTALSAIIVIASTIGKANYYGNVIDIILRLIHDFSILILGCFCFMFCNVFPRKKLKTNSLIIFVFFISICFFLISSLLNIQCLLKFNFEKFRIYNNLKLYLIDIPFILLIVAGIISLIHSYINYCEVDERRKLKWILFGVIVAPLNYIVLWVLPKYFYFHEPLVPEWFMTLMTTVAPITFFISIVRYRLLDIDFIINKSTVYSISILLLLAAYAGIERTMTWLFNIVGWSESILPSIASAVVIAILFDPVRKWLQRFIDKRFFKEKYNLNKCFDIINEEIKNCFSIEKTGSIILEDIKKYINISSLILIIYNNDNSNIEYSGTYNFSINLNEINTLFDKLSIISSSVLIARTNMLEDGINHKPLVGYFDYNPRICLIVPFITQDSSISCYFIAGQKKNKLKYTIEEIETLNKIITLAGNTIYKIILQKEITLKDEENKKLVELSNLKSFFVSSVSHELKTPLTSIKLFTELLQINKSITNENREKYLGIIQTECDRLNRLINNVLEYSKIERGTKKYCFNLIDLNEITDFVLDIMNNQLVQNKFEFEKKFKKKKLLISADKDSVVEVLINLISNSIKYSDKRKYIYIETFENRNYYAVKIMDSGIGISSNDIDYIFDAFFRSDNDNLKHAGGTGIGLSLVKSIIEAHQGYIDVESKPDIGSIFTIYFPKGA